MSFYFTQYYEYDHCFFYSFVTSWDFAYISFTYIRFYVSGSTRRSQFEIEFGKYSKTYARALKKNLSHLAGLAHQHLFIWQIFISPRRDLGKIKWDSTLAGWLTSHMNTLSFLKALLKKGEISPRWASPPRWDLTWFLRSHLGEIKIFPYEHAWVGEPGKVG